jgi:hypothetical protein
MRLSHACLAVCLVLAACSERDGTAPDPFAPSFDANPESSGAVVVRTAWNTYFTMWDPETELLVAHVFRDPYSACVPSTPYELYPLDRQRVVSEDAVNLVRQLVKAEEISIKVWHSTTPDWTVALRCSPPIAEGVGKLVTVDNDAFAYLPDNDRMRANSFGIMGHGTLLGPEGQQYAYSGTFRFVWRPAVETTADGKSRVRVQLVPAGS